MTTDRWVNWPEYLSERDSTSLVLLDAHGVAHEVRGWRSAGIVRYFADCGLPHDIRGSPLRPAGDAQAVTCMTCIVHGARVGA